MHATSTYVCYIYNIKARRAYCVCGRKLRPGCIREVHKCAQFFRETFRAWRALFACVHIHYDSAYYNRKSSKGPQPLPVCVCVFVSTMCVWCVHFYFRRSQRGCCAKTMEIYAHDAPRKCLPEHCRRECELPPGYGRPQNSLRNKLCAQ